MVNGKPTVISLFAGCGGSSLGYKWAGYHELLAVEWDKNAAETFNLNFPDVPCWQRDIREVTGKEILGFCGLEPGGLDLLDASPPCQGFSTAGKRQVADPRNDLFLEFVRLVKELQPKVFVMENVSGLVKGKMKGWFIEIMQTLKALPYHVRCRKMNAMFYGVPQSRERLIWIGMKDGEPEFPEPVGVPVKFRNAIDGCPNETDRSLPSVLLEVGKRQPDKWNTDAKIYRRIKGNNAGCFSLKWAGWNRVIGTIPKSEISLTGIIHPNRQRYLNIHELRRCASFPDEFQFTDRKNGCERIGNAVMPKFMEAIATTIKRQVFDGAMA